MSTDPHTLDAVLAHREALLAVVDGLRVRAESAEREVERLAGLLGRYGRGILGCVASGCEGCMVCDPEKVVERLTAELDAWHALARDYTLDADADGMDLVNAMRGHCDFERLWVSSLRAKGSQLIAERDEARELLCQAEFARDGARVEHQEAEREVERLKAEAKIAEDLVTWLQDRLTAERDAAYARGVEDERRAVVEHLRGEAGASRPAHWLADRIEAGLHRQGGDRG